jgi:hypothetical protein
MTENETPPKLLSKQSRCKVTLYIDADVAEIYRLGKLNGWNTPEIVREGATRAILANAEKLKEKAGGQ